MTECQHDPMFLAENEANGGSGCPICNRNRKRVVLAHHADGTTEIDPPAGWFINPVVTLEKIADMESRCRETATEPPTYDGMWM